MPYLKTSLLTILCLLVCQARAGEVVRYEGELTGEAVTAFLTRYADDRPVSLVIDSGGGEVRAGIRLGLWVFEQQLDIIVDGVCLSSCANYVFTAARHKTVTPGSVVGWHGNYTHLDQTGLWRDDVESRIRDGEDEASATREVRALVDELVTLESEFFTRTGVNEYLCWVGKMPPFNVPNYYTLSASDMAKYGVHNVDLPVDYRRSVTTGFDFDIRFIELSLPFADTR